MELDRILSGTEKTVLLLRKLFLEKGYRRYRMGKFEDYDFYARNRDFLPSAKIMTFTDGNGKLMAMKPDVTLSILRNLKNREETEKLFYNENVYRPDPVTGCYSEIMQMGIECIGKVDAELTSEVLVLADSSMGFVSENRITAISDLDIVQDVLRGISPSVRSEIISKMEKKSIHGIKRVCEEYSVPKECMEKVISLMKIGGRPAEAVRELEKIPLGSVGKAACRRLETIGHILSKSGAGDRFRVDFSIVDDPDYYSGIIFRGYISGICKKVISGGCYSRLMEKMGKTGQAIGFAIYFDSLEGFDMEKAQGEEGLESGASTAISSANIITIALPKGRLGKSAYKIMEEAGFGCPEVLSDSRKLIFENEELSIRYFWSKPSDVGIYVEHGVADIGITGNDILMENGNDIYELLDLGIGKCKMSVAGPKDYREPENITVATEFPNTANDFFLSKGKNIDIIKLNGSIELAPILGLSDVIVDIVQTGTTLKKNNLHVIEDIFDISARLVANKGMYEFKKVRIDEIMEGLKNRF